MANEKNKFNSHKSSSRTKRSSKVDKLQKLLIGFDNDKITELVMRDQTSPNSDDIEEPAEKEIVNGTQLDTVILKDSIIKREVHVPKDRFLTKQGYLKRKNKDNLQLCNYILKNELMIVDNREKQIKAVHNNINNNDLITSDQNKKTSDKEIEKNNKTKRRSPRNSEKSDQSSSSSEKKRKKANDSQKSKQKKKDRVILDSDDELDLPPLQRIRLPEKKGVYICDLCDRRYSTKSLIRRHMYIHLYRKQFPCGQCKKVFRKSYYLSAHITRQHPNWDQHYMCNLCNKPFLLKENLIAHMTTHTNTETKFKCFYCNQKFTQQHKLIAHEKKHLTVSGKYDCLVCEESFDCRIKLSLHFKTHLKVKDYICQHCGKEFLRMNSMKRHVQISHAGLRIQCPICKKVLKGHLSEHMRTHENKRPHKCPDCGQRFTQSTQLTVHRRSHSGARPYPCRICNRPFSHSNALMLHIRRHTGEKPFPCAMCPLSFSQLPHMKAHMRKIHGQTNPYRCKKCEQFFKLKIDLEDHDKVCQVGVKELSFEEKIQASVQVEEEEVVESVMSLSRMRFLLALLLTMIATKEKLKYLGA